MTKYPFTPELLDALPEELAELFRNLENTLLDEICSRLDLKDQLNEVTVQAIRALRSHGVGLDEIKKAIKKTSNLSDAKLDELINDVIGRNQRYYTELIDFAGLTQPEMLVSAADIDAIRRQTKDELHNITQSMGFQVDNGRTMLQPAKAYQWALDNAELQIQSGAINYNEAIKGAVKQLAESGLKTVNYESGHVDKIDVAVRRAVMTGINQVCDQYTDQSAEYLNTRYFEISAHSGARDKPGKSPWSSHKDWQGKVYYRSENGEPDPRGEFKDLVATTGYGYVDGLTGANCRHHKDPFLPDIMQRTYTDEQLAHIDDGLGCDFEGKHYTAYEATQMQRRLERQIRKQKQLKKAYKEAGLADEAKTANIKLRRLNAKYKEFSEAAGLPEQRERTNVSHIDEKTAAAVQEQKRAVENASEDVTISTGINAPINARDASVGRPNAVSLLDAKLSKRQETLLASLDGYDSRTTVRKRDVKMKDLAALTAKTGDEFAMFTKGGERLIVRGNRFRVQIGIREAKKLAALGYRWSGHTHPGYDELTKMPSVGDVKVLEAFMQEQSVIYDSLGRRELFRR